jgi:hypothetical protein
LVIFRMRMISSLNYVRSFKELYLQLNLRLSQHGQNLLVTALLAEDSFSPCSQISIQHHSERNKHTMSSCVGGHEVLVQLEYI